MERFAAAGNENLAGLAWSSFPEASLFLHTTLYEIPLCAKNTLEQGKININKNCINVNLMAHGHVTYVMALEN